MNIDCNRDLNDNDQNRLNNFGILDISKKYIIDEIIKIILKLKKNNPNKLYMNLDNDEIKKSIYEILNNSTHPFTVEDIINITDKIVVIIRKDYDNLSLNRKMTFKLHKNNRIFFKKIRSIIEEFEQDYLFNSYNTSIDKLFNIELNDIVKLIPLLGLIVPLLANFIQGVFINIQSHLLQIPQEFITFNYWHSIISIAMVILIYLVYYTPFIFIRPYNIDRASTILITIIFMLSLIVTSKLIYININTSKVLRLKIVLIILDIFFSWGFYISFYLPIRNPHFRTKELYYKYKIKRELFKAAGFFYFVVMSTLFITSFNNNDYMLLMKNNKFEYVILGETDNSYVIRNIEKFDDKKNDDKKFVDVNSSFELYPKKDITKSYKIINASLYKNKEDNHYYIINCK
ncbi:hypothetical protein [Anaerococcus nagyae]|uniref:hypothetical protein n=1 Tax=Anaerococcus nagyae TaxID=1755241 RepID=UPI003246B1C8